MKVTVRYTKNNEVGRNLRLKGSFEEGLPTADEIKEGTAVVFEGELDFGHEPRPDDIFATFNDEGYLLPNPLATPEGQAKVRETDTHTSMSPGDIVEIGDTAYVCQGCGWGTMKVEEVR